MCLMAHLCGHSPKGSVLDRTSSSRYENKRRSIFKDGGDSLIRYIRAIPCHDMPCHAMPYHAVPCHAMPSPQLQPLSWPMASHHSKGGFAWFGISSPHKNTRTNISHKYVRTSPERHTNVSNSSLKYHQHIFETRLEDH